MNVSIDQLDTPMARCVAVAPIALLSAWLAPAWAQTSPTPVPPVAPAQPSATSSDGAATGIAAIVVLIGLFAIVAVIVKVLDRKRKREAEAVHMQARISDAFLRESSLVGLPITPRAHIPFWQGSPATIELEGRVPSERLREYARKIAADEASRIRRDVRIEDHVAIAA
jgi:hypothetical protein